MTHATKQDIRKEIELAELMISDLQKVWKSYAKKVLAAKQEREIRQVKKGFLGHETVEELIEAFGYEYISEADYYKGLEYFENLKKPPELSVIETHRKRIKEKINLLSGTIKELQEELEPVVKAPEENVFDKIAREEREQRYKNMW